MNFVDVVWKYDMSVHEPGISLKGRFGLEPDVLNSLDTDQDQ